MQREGYIFSISGVALHPPPSFKCQTSLWSWEKMLGEGMEGVSWGWGSKHWWMYSLWLHRYGRDNSYCEHKQAEFNAAFFSSSMQLYPARATQEKFLSKWGSSTWEPCLTLWSGSFHDFAEVIGTQLETSMNMDYYHPPVSPCTSLIEFLVHILGICMITGASY